MTQIAKSEQGKLRANSLADKNNNLIFAECDSCPPNEVCQDSIVSDLDDTETLVSIDWNGTIVDMSNIAALDTTSAATIKVFTDAVVAQICAMLSTDFVDEHRPYLYGELTKEVCPGIEASWAADVLTVTHIGEGTLEDMITTNSTPGSSDTRDCSWASTCVTFLQGVDALGAVSINGGAGTALANDPYAHVGTPATDDATAAVLETDLAAAIATAGGTVYAISVTQNGVDEAYDMYVRVPFGDTVVLATAGAFIDQECSEFAFT